MEHSASGVSLLSASADVVTVAVGKEHCLKFTNEGVVHGLAGAPEFEPWARVSDLRVVFPAVRTRSWAILQTILEVLAPANMRSNQTRLELQTFDRGWAFFDLGYPDEFGVLAPQGQALSVEAAIDRLSQRGQLRRLGEPDFVKAMMEGLPSLSPLLSPLITWRVNRHVDALLVSNQAR